MRKGSDWWRPGALLKTVSELIVRESVRVTYDREDELCPTSELLAFYMDAKCPKNHPDFAAEYSSQLKESGVLEIAAAKVIINLARGILPAFYCVDPHLPGYGRIQEMLAGVPYHQRTWLCSQFEKLRNQGCHRFTLAEELARHFNLLGVAVEVYEIDPTFQLAVSNRFIPAFAK